MKTRGMRFWMPTKKCAAIFTMGGVGANEFTVGDGSRPVRGGIIDQATMNGASQPRDLTQIQIANGCEDYGWIGSKPSHRSRSLNIKNIGSTALTVNWISFYGAVFPLKKLQPGETFKNDRFSSTVTKGDVLSVVESDGTCVGLVRPTDTFIGTNSRNKGRTLLKSYYEFRDGKSSIEAGNKAADKKTHSDGHENPA